MSENQGDTKELPPHVQLIQMVTGMWVSRVLYAAARLRLADHLTDGPKSANDIAGATGTYAPALHRLMRTLASLGILTQDTRHGFALTPLGEALKTDAPGSTWATMITLGGGVAWHAWDEIMYSLETGKPGFTKKIGKDLFDYLAENPEEASLFSETMVGLHGREPSAVAAAYDFSGFKKVIDVGGATGNLLSAVLQKHAGPVGVLFDLPHVVTDAPALIETRGLQDRITIESGNFFEAIPGGGDVYLLSHIIHDWSEDKCLTILQNCRKAMASDGRVLIIEMVLPPGDEPHPGKMLDLMMLVGPGGQERTEEEYGELLERAGLRLTQVVPTASDVCVVEAIAA